MVVAALIVVAISLPTVVVVVLSAPALWSVVVGSVAAIVLVVAVTIHSFQANHFSPTYCLESAPHLNHHRLYLKHHHSKLLWNAA